MPRLEALNFDAHGDLSLSKTSGQIYARDQHMLPLRVTEISRAVSDFPVVISRASGKGDLTLSALTSLEPGQNLFLDGDRWQSIFQPVLMQTHPFYLMNGPTPESEPLLGLDAQSPALVGDGDGEKLFTQKGKPALWVGQKRAQLLDDARNMMHSFAFLELIDSLGLVRAIDISVKYGSDKINKIQGLNMINEDRFHDLAEADFLNLRAKGYLAPIYAMLFSVIQLNGLIRRHNLVNADRPILSINLEVSKDLSHS